MENGLKMLQNSPYAWGLLSVVAIVSLISAFYFGITGNRYKRITFFKKSNRLVSLKNVALQPLHLYFNNQEILDVSITRIAVWNSGNEVINKSDLVISKPLIIGVKEEYQDTTQILDCSIDYITDETNEINIYSPLTKPGEINNLSQPESTYNSNNKYTISFEYMAPKDGVILQIIHSGKPEDIYMDCQLKGGRKFLEVEESGGKIIPKRKRNILEKAIDLFPINIVLHSKSNSWAINYFGSIAYIGLSFCGLALFIFDLFNISEAIRDRTVLGLLIVCLIIAVAIFPFSYISVPKEIKRRINM